jgi:hypothetical protein
LEQIAELELVIANAVEDLVALLGAAGVDKADEIFDTMEKEESPDVPDDAEGGGAAPHCLLVLLKASGYDLERLERRAGIRSLRLLLIKRLTLELMLKLWLESEGLGSIDIEATLRFFGKEGATGSFKKMKSTHRKSKPKRSLKSMRWRARYLLFELVYWRTVSSCEKYKTLKRRRRRTESNLMVSFKPF